MPESTPSANFLLARFLGVAWCLALLGLIAVVAPEVRHQVQLTECAALHGVLVQTRMPDRGYQCIGVAPASTR
jgi:hypothetical protein